VYLCAWLRFLKQENLHLIGQVCSKHAVGNVRRVEVLQSVFILLWSDNPWPDENPFSFEPGKNAADEIWLTSISLRSLHLSVFLFFGGRGLFVILSATRWRFQKTKKLKKPMSESTFSYVALQWLSFHFISFGPAVMCVKFATVDRRLLMAVCLFGFWLSGDSQLRFSFVSQNSHGETKAETAERRKTRRVCQWHRKRV